MQLTYTHKKTHVDAISCFFTSFDQWTLIITLESSPLDGSSLRKSNNICCLGRQLLSGIILCGIDFQTFLVYFQTISETFVFFIIRVFSTYKGGISAHERVKRWPFI